MGGFLCIWEFAVSRNLFPFRRVRLSVYSDLVGVGWTERLPLEGKLAR